MPFSLQQPGQRGSILIFTLWVLMIIGLFALAAGTQARQRLRYVQQFEIRDKLRLAADSGIKRAKQMVFDSKKLPAHTLTDSWTNQEKLFKEIDLKDSVCRVSYVSPSDGAVRYGAVDEARKIDLNKVKSPLILAGIFEFGAGVTKSQAQEIAASILDWRDEDDVLNAGGAETRYYRSFSPPYEPKNADLDTLEELLLIKGVTPEVFLKVQPYVTVDGDAVFNINTAPAPVFLAYGFSAGLVEKILNFRRGRDLVEGTFDDRPFKNRGTIVADLKQVTSLGTDEEKSLKDFTESGILDVKSFMFSAVSTANIKERKEKLTTTCYFSLDGALRRCQETFGRLDEKSDQKIEDKKELS